MAASLVDATSELLCSHVVILLVNSDRGQDFKKLPGNQGNLDQHVILQVSMPVPKSPGLFFFFLFLLTHGPSLLP